LHVLPAQQSPSIGRGPFRIRRVRPGLALGAESGDPALGPLSVIDHSTLAVGTVVPMHQHINDEILSYMWRGVMVHEDSDGNRVELCSRRLMMMGAGKGFWHEESVPTEPVEMLQIFIRPEATDLKPQVEFWERPEPSPGQGWQLVAGPEGSTAPLTIRQRVMVFDAHPKAGDELDVPTVAGPTPWVYVLDGSVTAGGQQLGQGDALTDLDASLPPIRVGSDSVLVAFLVDRSAPASLRGTMSGG
jgi:quercetin 2,3-dioxygenase